MSRDTAREKFRFETEKPPLVKVCGLTQVDNAMAVAEAGPDLIGLVFFPKSPRNVSLSQAGRISRALPSRIAACGVFVDAHYDTVMATAEACGLAAVQLHGTESPQTAVNLSRQGLIVIKAFFATRNPTLDLVKDYPGIDYYLAEYGKGVLPGGNAEVWDYGMVKGSGENVPLVLAGGLSPENVAMAVACAHPSMVDASSSLESAPGIKDIPKVTAFIQNAKAGLPAPADCQGKD